MIEFLFLDLDDTILDFHRAERVALEKTLHAFHIVPTPELFQGYSRINLNLWHRLERGEVTRQQVLDGRFRRFVQEYELSAAPERMAEQYEENLAVGHYFLPGAEKALKSLHRRYKLYLASNGTARVQAGRLKSAGITPYFQNIFVSEALGANKPETAYFDRCFSKIPNFEREKAMIVGDSLTSDILGGIRAGIHTAWVNPGHKKAPPDIQPDYEIAGISQLEALLDSI